MGSGAVLLQGNLAANTARAVTQMAKMWGPHSLGLVALLSCEMVITVPPLN